MERHQTGDSSCLENSRSERACGFDSHSLLYYKNTSHDSLLDGRFGRYDLMVVHDY